MYHFKTADGDGASVTELKQYHRDSKRSLKGYWNRKYAHLKSMWNTVTLFTPLLMVGTVLATHSIA